MPPPRARPGAGRRYLAYGSSITHGNNSLGATGTYAMRMARRLGVDLINLGFGGGAHCEPVLADYIAARDDWDFATLELGINMVTWLDTADFAERVRTFVRTIAEAHPDKWIFCIDMFPFHMDFDPEAERNHAYRAVVRETVAELALPRLVHIDGRDLLRDLPVSARTAAPCAGRDGGDRDQSDSPSGEDAGRMTETDRNDWLKRRNRGFHVTIRDVDCRDFDVQRFIADLKSMHVTFFSFFVGGYVTTYPTALEYQRDSPYLDGRDLTGEIIREAHAAGIKVLGMIDLGQIPEQAARDHPDWCAQDRDGAPVERLPGLYAACPMGGYQNDYVREIVGEILGRYDLDCVKFGGGSFGFSRSICYCPNCRADFHAATGHDLPLRSDWADPAVARLHCLAARPGAAARPRAGRRRP